MFTNVLFLHYQFVVMNRVLYTSNSCEWSTPQDLFDRLNSEFHFTLDVCASDLNHKCPNYYTLKDDGLVCDWYGRVWCNPPYGHQIKFWVERAFYCKADIVVMLLPARTDTRWFHQYIYNKAEIRFIRGRLHFNNTSNSAPFPSMIVIFRKYA